MKPLSLTFGNQPINSYREMTKIDWLQNFRAGSITHLLLLGVICGGIAIMIVAGRGKVRMPGSQPSSRDRQIAVILYGIWLTAFLRDLRPDRLRSQPLVNKEQRAKHIRKASGGGQTAYFASMLRARRLWVYVTQSRTINSKFAVQHDRDVRLI